MFDRSLCRVCALSPPEHLNIQNGEQMKKLKWNKKLVSSRIWTWIDSSYFLLVCACLPHSPHETDFWNLFWDRTFRKKLLDMLCSNHNGDRTLRFRPSVASYRVGQTVHECVTENEADLLARRGTLFRALWIEWQLERVMQPGTERECG